MTAMTSAMAGLPYVFFLSVTIEPARVSLSVQLIAFYPQSVRAIKVREDPGRSNGEKMTHSQLRAGRFVPGRLDANDNLPLTRTISESP